MIGEISSAIDAIISAQTEVRKPLAVILAGHNGSGKSTLWRKRLSGHLRVPLVNADRMLLATLPETTSEGALVEWARVLRDTNEGWMRVAQKGVQGVIAHAMQEGIPFAFETVFSHWTVGPAGKIESKIDQIKEIQNAGYFVLLVFVGLTSSDLSILRVQTRIAMNGHHVDVSRLVDRFPRTQRAISSAIHVADASILLDNSRSEESAFTVCSVLCGGRKLYDIRRESTNPPNVIRKWLDIIYPG